ncbi:hypothetical protein [Synechococcus sp. MIT S1220]|uniref:hypothetical protein n=1 Tax=Synechococcus sp. MIT S1220 TaxID=3082549 RepID=UPI0039AFC2CC
MADLALVINLGSSSLKAALVDSTGAFPWHSGRAAIPPTTATCRRRPTPIRSPVPYATRAFAASIFTASTISTW